MNKDNLYEERSSEEDHIAAAATTSLPDSISLQKIDAVAPSLPAG